MRLLIGLLTAGLLAATPVLADAPDDVPEGSKVAEAVALAKAGKYADAERLMAELVVAEPGNADAWSQLGFARRKQSHHGPALEAYQRALAISPLHKGANEYLGELYVETDQIDKAKERVEVLRRACPAGCEELEDLLQALEDHEHKHGG